MTLTVALQNGDFEGSAVRSTHTGQAIPEIESPEGWVTFWREDAGYKRPECKVISPKNPLWPQWQDPKRYNTGSQSWQCFTAFGKMWAGLYQTVSGLIPGKRYKLQAYAHAWSFHPGIDSRANSANCSVGVGCGPVEIACTDIPDLNGNYINDAIGNFRFAVGVTQGSIPDPFNANYGSCKAIYNAFAPVEYEFVAEGTEVVVYLLAKSLWNFQNSDAYWDTVTLTQLDGSSLPTTNLPYVVVANLLPQDTTLSELQDVTTYLHSKRETFMYSADDAIALAVAGMEGSKVVVWDGNRWNGDILQYLHAAGVQSIESKRFSTLTEVPVDVVQYSQRDGRWKSARLLPSTETIGSSGCAVTCMAMLSGSNGLDPGELNAWLGNHAGYTDDGRMYWKVAAEKIGKSFVAYHVWRKSSANMDVVQRVLKSAPSIIQVDFYPGGSLDSHFVLGLGFTEDGNDIDIIDPWTGAPGTLLGLYADEGWNLGRAIYALVELSDSATDGSDDTPGGSEERPLHNTISLHLQDRGPWNEILEFVRDTKPSVIKIFDVSMAQELHSASPSTKIVYRHHINNSDIMRICDSVGPGMQWFFEQLPHDLNPLVDAGHIHYLETPLNEANSVGVPLLKWIAGDVEFVKALRQAYPQLLPVVATISVGNPGESEYASLLPLAKEVVKSKGAFGYHAYWPSSQQGSFLVSDWKWHAGRWTEIDAVLLASGVKVDWILSECGPCGGAMHENPRYFAYDAEAGWRAPNCCGGDWGRTLNEILMFKSMLDVWNAGHENRCLGGTLFTICPFDWHSFDLEGPQIDSLCTELAV